MSEPPPGPDRPSVPGLAELSALLVLAMTATTVVRFDASPLRLMTAVLGVGLAAVARVDAIEHRIPDRLVIVQLVSLAVAAVAVSSQDADGRVLRAVIGGGVAFALFFTMRVIAPSGIGGGDVKEAVPIGFGLAWFTPAAMVLGIAFAFVINGVVGAVLLARGRAHRDSRIPFGPSLAVGAMLAVLLSS